MKKLTNRMSIERKKICQKCKNKSYDYTFYVEKQSIFYCCESCAIKYSLKNITTLSE